MQVNRYGDEGKLCCRDDKENGSWNGESNVPVPPIEEFQKLTYLLPMSFNLTPAHTAGFDDFL